MTDTLLKGNDANLYILYFACGGLILGFSFLTMLAMIIYDLLESARIKVDNKIKMLVYANLAGIIFLLLTQLFNNNGVLFLILFFYCTCRAGFVNSQVKI